MSNKKLSRKGPNKTNLLPVHIVLIIMGVMCAGAFLLVLGSSFQTEKEIQQWGYSIIPRKFSLEAYKTVFTFPQMIIDAYFVTFLTTVIGTIIGVFLSASAGYVISRRNYRYNRILTLYIFFTMLFSGGLVPNYILMTQWLDLKNSIWSLILPNVVHAWYIMLMKGFFKEIPEAMMESAKIDGASELRIFLRIVLPVSTPVLATISLFYVLGYWNEWFLSLMYIDDQRLIKLQYLLMQILKKTQFMNSEAADAMTASGVPATEIPTLNVRMATCVVAVAPLLVVFPFVQKYFVKGVTVGSVKG